MRRAAAFVLAVVVLFVTPAHAAAPTDPEHATTAPAATTAAAMNSTPIDGLGGVYDSARTRPLPDGRWLSFTGDATAEPGQIWPVYDNTAIIWDTNGAYRVNVPGHFFPRWEDDSEFWPHDFAVVGTRVYVIGNRVKSYPGSYNWDQLGAFGAVVDVPAGGQPRFVRYFPTPSSLLTDEAVQWYGAITVDGSDVYLHGVKNRPDAYHGRDGGYVARVPMDRLEVPHRWTFWTGTGWTPRHDLAVPTIPIWTSATNGTSSSYTLHRRPNGEWQVTTKRGGDIASGLGRYVAGNPWGPWTWQPLLADVCAVDCYMVGAAPGVPTVSGDLLVQWSRTDSSPVWAEVPQ